MLKKKDKNSLNEHLERIKYISKHRLGEAKYSPVFEMDEDDELDMKHVSPSTANNTGIFAEADDDDEMTVDDISPEEQLAGAVGDGSPEAGPEPSMDDANAGEQVADMPDAGIEDNPMGEPQEPIIGGEEAPADPMMGEPAQPSADEQREDIQNQLIKLQLSAIDQMNDKMKMMDSTMEEMKSVMGRLHSDVEEVREPTNVEKVAARKDDSHPYYYRLNDLWQGNSFQARMDDGKTGEHGMKQLEDGSYIADFDNFPKLNDMDIKKSF